MKYVLLVYQGTTPLPGTDRWKALPAAEQKQIYADYAALNQAPGVAPGLPLGLPDAARTVQVRDGGTGEGASHIHNRLFSCVDLPFLLPSVGGKSRPIVGMRGPGIGEHSLRRQTNRL